MENKNKSKNTKIKFMPCLFITLIFYSCGVVHADKENIALLSKAYNFYVEGHFDDVKEILSAKNSGGRAQRFIPILILRGKSEYFSGDILSAEKTFKRILKLNPAQIESRLFIARILLEQNKPVAAQKAVEEILANSPGNLNALLLASKLAKENDGGTASLAFLDNAANEAENLSFVFLDRAREYWVMGKNKLALADIKKAKALVAETEPIYKSIKNLESAIITNISAENTKENTNQ
ncbi:MAG: tetratricopeptide repeat protein [Spirochaetaceae bacterium]|jgi:tetratricopeptide (TPR) repeat protein|nr:tetratricopeptide repeat protein [Spirochaetaceae bacterium]